MLCQSDDERDLMQMTNPAGNRNDATHTLCIASLIVTCRKTRDMPYIITGHWPATYVRDKCNSSTKRVQSEAKQKPGLRRL